MKIAALDAKIAAGEAKIAAGEAKIAAGEATIALVSEAKSFIDFVGYSVLVATEKPLSSKDREALRESLEKYLSDPEVRKIFQADRTLTLVEDFRIALSRPNERDFISKELLQSIARVAALKQPIVRRVDSINPGTAVGFRTPLRELSRLSGVMIEFE